ncbi:MAG TPA: DegQ family serine endoprotease [Blastocatellia bacterium]|nr:DegQ family serine endoprotease [Blastocatellia bacterium]
MSTAILAQRPVTRQQAMFFGLIGAGLLLLGVVSGAVIKAQGWLPFGGNENKVPIYVAADQRTSQALTLNTGFSAVAKAVTPAVVTVETQARTRPMPQMPFFGDPFDFFRRGFPGLPDDNDQQPRRRTPRQAPEGRGRLQPSGIGSGVIVSPDGYILTNNHVVEGADKVEVVLNDSRRFTARVVGTDAPSDIAVLKIGQTSLPTIPLGDSNAVEVGDVVLAIGNPLGVGQTVTMGIISAKGRSTRAGSGSYEDFLQTDAAINRGNSGGALVNLKGELIGIPSQILSQTGGNIGIGFAIPTAMARNVMDQLIRSGKVTRGKLGITISALAPEIAEQFGYKGTKGALVQDVEAGQPAERAGVRPGDIITEFQGQRIEDDVQLRNLVAQTAPGTTVRFKIFRDGAERELTATLGELEVKTASSRGGSSPGEPGSALVGVQVENLTAETARRLNLPVTARGVVITDIDSDSPAADAGLQRGDLIVEVNRQPVTSVSEFNTALQRAGKKSVLLRVRRADGARFVVIEPRE